MGRGRGPGQYGQRLTLTGDMTNGAAALFMRTAYQNAAIYFGDTPLDSLLSQQLLRATTFGYWLSPTGGSRVRADAGRTGDHRPGRGPGYRQGRAGVLCAGTRSQGWVSAGTGGHDVLHDDPLTAGHGRPVDGSGCDPDCDGSNFGLLETTVLPVGGTRV